jgi:hypothetical protein
MFSIEPNPPEGRMPEITIRFLCPSDWATPPRIHTWDREPGHTGSDWPGEPMQPDADHPGWYRTNFPATTRLRLVFNDGQGRQSGDLARERDGWFSFDTHWRDAAPDAPAAAAAQQAAQQPAQNQAKRTDFREETIYFLLTARFNDGDPSNNFFCRDRIRSTTRATPSTRTGAATSRG